MSTIIKLESYDKKIFDVDLEVAMFFGTIRTMFQDCGLQDDENPIIPLPNVRSDILELIIYWVTYHKNDLKQQEQLESADESEDNENHHVDEISPFDANFFDVDQTTMFDIISAANYLDIKGLLNIGCKTVANMMKNKTPEDIRQTFNITNDFTTDEEQEVRISTEWCLDK